MLNIAPCHDPEYALREVTRDASEYYLREGESPGRWWGAGATALGLGGEVDAAALRDLFAGKHPHTGEYLISARGSSARANARVAEADLDAAAAAALLGLSVEGVRSRLRAGTLAGEKTPRGDWRIPASAIEAHLAGRPAPASLGALPTPAADGSFAISEAARLAGVNVSYLKRLVTEEAPAKTLRDDGRPVQYLLGRRDDHNRWRVAASELERFMVSRSAPRPVPAYDLVMRAPKSVSILHALGHLVPPTELEAMGLPAGVAAQVVEAHHAAVTDALELLQRHAAFTRSPGRRVMAQGLAVARFDHRSSRTGDPLLHTHAVIANAATGIDGRRAALDGTALYAWASTAGHLYQARLRAELVARLGVRFEQPHNGVADIMGVPREVIDAFSSRRRQILELMETVGSSGPAAAQVATLATRPSKDERSHRSPHELAAMAAEVGFGSRELVGLLGHEPPARPSHQHLGEIAAHLAGPEGLCARATLVDLRDAIKGFATEAPAGATGAELERWAATLLHDGGALRPRAGPPHPQRRRHPPGRRAAGAGRRRVPGLRHPRAAGP
jgi:conjugative relaxase-like TrwC/TraI family protein